MLNSDTTLPEIDLRSVSDAVIRRWWIIPLVMLISVGFLFANESDLQTTPGFVRINRRYEARDESAVMSIAGIDPASIVPYPSFDNQLMVLQSPETHKEIADKTGVDVNVSVARTDQTFTLIDTNDTDGKKRFTFLSAGSPSYTFECEATTSEDCNIAIDAYVAEISRLRAMSIEQGFERAEKIIKVLVDNSPSDDQSARNQQLALETGKSLVTGEVALISNVTEEFGPSIDKVKASTYGFGLGIGALLGFLIVLQLSVTDKRIRTVRKLNATVGGEHNLGVLRVDGKDTSAQHVAAGLVHQLALHSATTVRLLSVDGENSESVVSTLTQALQGNTATVTSMNGADHLTTNELLPPPHSIVVLIADSKTSRSDDLKNVWTIAENAGNEVAGVILVQH